jgi:RNA polymerase sigma-70 factor (ECF subfamily)
MAEPLSFELLLAAARAGDGAAMEQLARQYEPELRIVARLRLGPALRPYLDSVDLVQSVHRSLMMGLRDNRFDVTTPQNLLALALTIVRRKAARHWRHLQRQKRLGDGATSDATSQQDVLEALLALKSTQPGSQAEADLKDQLSVWMSQLDPIEQQLVALRIEGHSTVEVAHALGLDPDVLRVKLSRLRKRMRDHGIEEALLS